MEEGDRAAIEKWRTVLNVMFDANLEMLGVLQQYVCQQEKISGPQ